MNSTFYHGTQHRAAILLNGIDVNAPRSHDAGDLGWGFYIDRRLGRAEAYGEVLECELSMDRMAHIPNPYFLDGLKPVAPTTPEEKLFHDLAFDGDEMKTVRGDNREDVAKAIRETFLRHGYIGILTDSGEAVVFDCTAMEIRELPDESADESAEISRLSRKIAKEQGLRLTDICHRCGDSRHVCRCNT